MSNIPTPELLTEAAGVKIFMTPLAEERCSTIDCIVTGKKYIRLKNTKKIKTSGKSCGFHLTKSKWDLYPWVSYIETGSIADISGLRSGDCLIAIDGKDLMGLRIKEIATLIHDQVHEEDISLCVWRYTDEEEKKEVGLALNGPLPDVANKLANAVSGAVRILECPICLESSMPPVSQCVHGHIICFGCRPRTPRCPVCRVKLGQGRCLLADKLHKVFRDVFDVKDDPRDNGECETLSLRDRLFGKSKKKQAVPNAMKNNGVTSKTRHLLLTKLLLGGLGKAASADNLTTVSEIDGGSPDTNETLTSTINFSERLSLHDRTKSASTGELSRESKHEILNNPLRGDVTSSIVSSTISVACSTPQSPIWGGSMESVSCTQITCPLSKQNGCKDIITPGTLLDHLSRNHDVPQIHFYSANVKIPLPLPFGPEAVYILHHAGHLFFLNFEYEALWMTCATGGTNMWEWMLHGEGENGNEIKIRKTVGSLEDPLALSPRHVAPLPNALLLNRLNIQLLECSHEKLDV